MFYSLDLEVPYGVKLVMGGIDLLGLRHIERTD